jgi:hypothetical protein
MEIAPNFPTQKALTKAQVVSKNMVATTGQAKLKIFLVILPVVRSTSFFGSAIFIFCRDRPLGAVAQPHCVILTPAKSGRKNLIFQTT